MKYKFALIIKKYLRKQKIYLHVYMYPPVHPLPWITAVLHKARPAQVDHGGDDDDGDVILLQYNYFACILIIVNSSSDNGVDRGRRGSALFP